MTNHNKNISYLRVGSFVLTGIILLIVAIIIFGSGILFKRVIYAETYFKESVQGLAEGSKVKYLGVEIGFVKEINVVENIYPEAKQFDISTHAHYVYVKLAILPKFFVDAQDGDNFKEKIEQLVVSGLRVKLAPQGLTGNVYLELSFFDPAANPVLPINWQPEFCYVPSVTSTLTYFTDNAQYLFSELRKIDFKKVFDDIDHMVNSTDNLMQRMDKLVAQTNQQFISTVNDLDDIANNINTLSEQLKNHPSGMLFGNPPPKLDPNKL